MALLPVGADVRELLGRLRPGSEFGWRGGPQNDTEQVVYRDPSTSEPTEAEYLAEQAIVLAENGARRAENTARGVRLSTTVGKHLTATSATEREALLEQLLFRAGATDKSDGTIKNSQQWDET